jgi:hypothetical protein
MRPCFQVFCVASIALLGLAERPAPAIGQTRSPARFDLTRDLWVSAVGKEADGNNGGAPRLKLKSIQEMSLVDVDAKPLLGRTITSATLHLKKSGEESLLRVTVSSVGAEWFEGTGSAYALQDGASTFRHRRHPDLGWSIAGGNLCHVILGNGGTLWGMAEATPPDRDGWQLIPVDPRVVAARVAGLSNGFLVFDDTGSEWTRTGDKFNLRIFPNRFVYSREQNRASAPYFMIETGPEDHRPPAAPREIKLEAESALLPAGEAIVSWLTPADDGPARTIGFFASLDGREVPRELVPLATASGARVQMHLRDLALKPGATVKLALHAVDGAGNRGPVAASTITVSNRIAERLPSFNPQREPAFQQADPPLPSLGGAQVAVIDELDKIHPVSGELIPSEPAGYLAHNHLWDARTRTIALSAARNEFVAFQVLLRGNAQPGQLTARLAFDGPEAKGIQAELGRYYPIATKLGLIGDPIVPMSSAPSPSAIRQSQSLHAEVYVPHSVPAGTYRGTVTLSGGSAIGSLNLAVTLNVWNFHLPDHLSFLPEMNCYGLPDNERAYYRLAHRHRTVLNRLPYNQNGQMQDGCAPRWDSKRLHLEWAAWDRRFGPLLDGSAFSDLPRKNVPVECLYLPLHENWPSPMEGNFNGSYWADQAFPESYRQAFVAAARQFAQHLARMRWDETLFQGFLNNKNNFKERGWSRGSSPWLLDEPANFQDYWALRYFARAFHDGVNQGLETGASPRSRMPRLVFRVDDSRPQWRRDSLDGLVDYHVVGSALRSYPQLVIDRKRAFGEIVLEYGSTNAIEASNFQPVGWCLDVWTMGADGVVPWHTVGNAESWELADELALFYPARAATRDSGPIPSARLKAYRRGQQDVEYLELWSQERKAPRWAVGREVRAALKLSGQRESTSFTAGEDAGRIDYARLRPRELWALRTAIGTALSQAHPALRTKLVDFRTPPRHPERLPAVFSGTRHDR